MPARWRQTSSIECVADVALLVGGQVDVTVGGTIVADDDSLKCWGRGSYGQIGDGTTTLTNIWPVNP
ncbi:hypothetical protein T484DRAFT_1846287 [Baffinella frigidus]|nr:hypothetical protein T484DRAFT_1846287 [Cryptophyta sp. CCMP2293]